MCVLLFDSPDERESREGLKETFRERHLEEKIERF